MTSQATEQKRPKTTLPPRIADVVNNELWPGIARVRPEDLGEADFIIHEVRFLTGEYGEFAVARSSYPDNGEEFTVPLSGVVVMRKLHDLDNEEKWPVVAKRVMVNNYWDLV
jgi:hypothetical protein